MEGIGLYILLFIVYAISALMKKKQEAGKNTTEFSGEKGPAENKVPDLVRELFGLPPEGEVEIVEEEEQSLETVLEEEIPEYEQDYRYFEPPPEEEDVSHLTYDDLETVTEEAYVPEEFPHDVNTFEEDRVEDHHAGQKIPKRKKRATQGSLNKLLSSKSGLQNGIILTEILGPPKALRKRA